jgi:hypothetical protein
MGRGTKSTNAKGNLVSRSISGRPLLFIVNAIPDAMSVPAARELVGQPHLLEHTRSDDLTRVQGNPVHLIACHKSVTEAQAVRMLGFPNRVGSIRYLRRRPRTKHSAYSCCPVQRETTTRHGVQRFLGWLDESEQAAELVRHAAKRKVVVKVLASS